MREILFRGKRVSDGEWVYGDLVHGVMKHEGHSYIWSKVKQAPLGSYEYEVIPETVGQYIGACDKDGNKIFEGDVLKEYGSNILYIIGYEASSFCYYCLNNTNYKMPINDHESDVVCEWFSIIGNIHDNPELLEV